MLEEVKILWHHGKQFIPDLTKATVPKPFRGRPEISQERVDEKLLAELCPTGAISTEPMSIDLGKCSFCGECAIHSPNKIIFTNDHKLATNDREKLIIREGDTQSVMMNVSTIRKEIKSIFNRSLKLRQISAGGDASCEMELGACGNPNFDLGRFGIEFVSSPRHADGIVITGPISENMFDATMICHEAVPEPRLVVLCGVDAISGGIFEGSGAINRTFLSLVPIDLYVPGNPPHPLTFINGILELTRKKFRRN
jgi:Ni,Fe-hydrogenase III small subunit